RPFEERRLTPHGQINPDYGAVSTLRGGGKGKRLGGPIQKDEAGLEAVFGRGVATGTRPLPGGAGLRASGGAGVSQWVLRAVVCDDFRDPGLRIARTRTAGFLPGAVERFQR